MSKLSESLSTRSIFLTLSEFSIAFNFTLLSDEKAVSADEKNAEKTTSIIIITSNDVFITYLQNNRVYKMAIKAYHTWYATFLLMLH
jgi:hypothetical protein